ncbi:glycosyltransferase [Rufibacter sp. LB8]|uniref:glycosyltransferase n=1 Tax=Rufibacter sp. LB8 TaxID=2777781 RepID=UPI00178C2B70|nr:glycosyltransferase [Rufibacter sp. LB8]
MKRKVIVHIIDSLGRGGAETLLIGVVNSLAEFNHVIISLKPLNEFELELQGVKVHFLNLKWYHSIPGVAFEVKKIIKASAADVVHANLFWSSIVSRIATPRNVKLINSYHALIYGSEGANYPVYARLLDKFTYYPAITTLCVSKGVKDNLAVHVGINKNAHILHNYIEDAFYSNYRPARIEEGKCKLVAVGNLKEDKNYKVIIEAFSQLSSPLQEHITLDVYGKGALLESLKEQCRNKQVSNIYFKGSVTNVAAILPAYDAFILSSKTEGFGIAVAEAMAVGLPVIVSDLPVLREITAGIAVYFDPFKPGSLCQVIEDFVTDKRKMVELSAKGHDVSRLYQKDLYLKKLTEFYFSDQ